ncbi:hypothetical protein V9T40_002378 [Parthenolecanium corni]|uniref:Uncharacterized protein n=1 Tax=Parthenolecanium corni TaxID=536013 RepID=A0AAN9TGL7_9HEMI
MFSSIQKQRVDDLAAQPSVDDPAAQEHSLHTKTVIDNDAFPVGCTCCVCPKKNTRVKWDSKKSRRSAEDSLARKLEEKNVPPHTGCVLVCIGDWRELHRKNAMSQFDMKWVDEYMISRACAKCHERMPLPINQAAQIQGPHIGGHHPARHLHRFQMTQFKFITCKFKNDRHYLIVNIDWYKNNAHVGISSWNLQSWGDNEHVLQAVFKLVQYNPGSSAANVANYRGLTIEKTEERFDRQA